MSLGVALFSNAIIKLKLRVIWVCCLQKKRKNVIFNGHEKRVTIWLSVY